LHQRTLSNAVGVVMLTTLLQACTGPPLEPWHTERLHEEFEADGTEVGSLRDYFALEDRLFEELDDEVYGRVGTGPAEALVRYSRGSAADPSGWSPNWNRSFELLPEAPRGGVLLLHGMSDSPYSLRALGETLRQRGFHVVGLRMPGHGTAPSGLTRVHWRDMAAVTRLGMIHLAGAVPDGPLHIVGYSTGAALAVSYALDAQEEPGLASPASLVLISPAIGVSRAAGLARCDRRWVGCPACTVSSGSRLSPSSIPTSTTPSPPTRAIRCIG
jgi:alpha-beta hydrolase superfamily lysophospholipase